MAQNKTQPSTADVEAFLEAIAEAQRRQDCLTLVELMREATEAEPVLWGTNIIGFGQQHYRYASGREGDWFVVGFSPRKQNLTLYLASGVEQHSDLLQGLGKHSLGKACLYVKRLADVDLAVLRALLQRSVEETHAQHAASTPPAEQGDTR